MSKTLQIAKVEKYLPNFSKAIRENLFHIGNHLDLFSNYFVFRFYLILDASWTTIFVFVFNAFEVIGKRTHSNLIKYNFDNNKFYYKM